VDFVPIDKRVQRHDLNTGLPFRDGIFDFVYLSHVLEHFSRSDALKLLRDCRRVLSPGGAIRVVVPDLEAIARQYLQCVREVELGEHLARERHEWIVIELVDQLSRHSQGGAMFEWFCQKESPILDFVTQRIGAEAASLRKIGLDKLNGSAASQESSRSIGTHLLSSIRDLCRQLKTRHFWTDGLLRSLLTDDDLLAMEIGQYRRSGEPHLWMYDRISLGSILESAGFIAVMRRSAEDSTLEGWRYYELDLGTDGVPYKPDSLYMEGVQPLESGAVV
jgi:SAM-dependent methyltransferase